MPAVSALLEAKVGSGSWNAITYQGVDAAPGATVYFRLASSANVDSWSLSVQATDDSANAVTLTWDGANRWWYCTAPNVTTGTATLLKSVVVGAESNATAFATMYTLTSASVRVHALGEKTEGDAYGWGADVNMLLRAYTGATTASDPVAKGVFVRNVTQSGVPTGALCDGNTYAADDVVLCIAQTSAVDNGLFTIKSGAWERVYLTAGNSACGRRVFVHSGRRYASHRFECRSISGSDVVGTNALTWRCVSSPTGFYCMWDLDFTAWGLQTFSADTDYTYAGTALTYTNSAHDAADSTIGDANGLYVQPGASKDIDSATYNAPGIVINPYTYWPELTWTSHLRMMVRIISCTTTAAGDGWIQGVVGRSGGATTQAILMLGRGQSGTTEGIYYRYINNNSTRQTSTLRSIYIPGSPPAYAVHALDIPHICTPRMMGMGAAALSGGDWPADSTWNGTMGVYDYVSSTPLNNWDGNVPGVMRCGLFATRSGTSVTKFGNWRCDVKIH